LPSINIDVLMVYLVAFNAGD